MQDYPAYSPTNTNQLIMSIIFYALLVVFSFFSLSSIFVVVKSGRSRAVSVFVSLLYLLFYVSLAAQGITQLNKIR